MARRVGFCFGQRKASVVTRVDNTPFFILGCVRSGTTMLRDALRRHPRLEAPEETFFYRWGDPMASPRFVSLYRGNRNIQKHRQLDGITAEEFETLSWKAQDRADLARRYGELYLEKRGNPDGRWFDKTPQNVYGIHLLSEQLPEAKIVHIVRHPLNVVASLVLGRELSKHSVKGAFNYWLEAQQIMASFRALHPERLIEVRYEDVIADPRAKLGELLAFLGEDARVFPFDEVSFRPEQHRYRAVISEEDQARVVKKTSPFRAIFDYPDFPDE